LEEMDPLQDFSWVSGDDPRVLYREPIGMGGFGEVHKVSSVILPAGLVVLTYFVDAGHKRAEGKRLLCSDT
jgi:hypothetical protein